MLLWTQWLNAASLLRPACSRAATFAWLLLALMGLCCRGDNAGVTSFVRVLGLSSLAYARLLHLFHSAGVDLAVLSSCWVRACVALFLPYRVGSRMVVLADGIKAPKEGRRMPAVKLLHQQSAGNTKPEYIMGHSLQAISLLVHSVSGTVAAIPLVARIHEGLVFSNRDTSTLLDKLVVLLQSVAGAMSCGVVLVADAYYASGKLMRALLANGHHLVSRAKRNAVAYLPVVASERRGRGRPKVFGEKVCLKDLALEQGAFTEAPSPVYGERNVTLRYRTLDLLWRPLGSLVRFVIVCHPTRGTIFLLCTDLTMQPLEILKLYGYRFKIELGFRQAVHVMGTYAYHFWMKAMKPLRRGSGDQYLHRTTDAYRAGIRRKLAAYHLHVQLGCIAQGLLQHLAINYMADVWHSFSGWLRTIKKDMPPSELVVANALQSSLFLFLAVPTLAPAITKVLNKYRRHDPPSEVGLRAA